MWDLLVVWAQALKQGIDTYLDPLGIVLGLVLAFPIFGTWWEVTVGRRRREQRWFREIRRKPGERPAILILDLLPGRSVRPAFEQFLQVDAGLKEISGDRVFVIARDANLTPEELTALRRALRDTAARIYANGTDTLHYFHAGPTFVAALVGAEFANGCRDMLYGHDQGTYINFGPLRMHREGFVAASALSCRMVRRGLRGGPRQH